MPSENSRFTAGQTIGHYTLIECKGEGAFGEVWKAKRHTALAAPPVALKLSRFPQQHRQAVQDEAERWVTVTGLPNILPVIEASVYDGEVVIVSQYIEGGTLTQWLNKHGGKAPSMDAAIQITAGILMGLEGLHSQGIVHRDLKPDNVLMQGETPLLTDFGISRIVEHTSAYTQQATGTRNYMPPEAFETKSKVSKKSDQWAVGVMLYRMLTGHLPFPQDEWGPYMNAVMNSSHPELLASVPAHVCRVIAQALHKNPEQRFASAAAMRTALLTPDSVSHSLGEKRLTEIIQRAKNILTSPSQPYQPSQQATVAAPLVSSSEITSSSNNRMVILLSLGIVGLYAAITTAFFFVFDDSRRSYQNMYEPGYPALFIFMALIQTAMIFVPTRLAMNLTVSRKSLLLPIIISGLWFGVCIGLSGLAISIILLRRSVLFASVLFRVVSFLGFHSTWIVWSIAFHRKTKIIAPQTILNNMTRILAKVGIVLLILAGLSYFADTRREYRELIPLGVSVTLFSLCPSILYRFTKSRNK